MNTTRNTMRATDTTNERRYLNERGAALCVRSIGAPFYKRRPTPKPGLDFRCNYGRFFAQRLCRCLPRFGRKHAAAIADLSQILPQTYRRRAEREPSADCMACCARSMSCSRAALHIARCSLRQRLGF